MRRLVVDFDDTLSFTLNRDWDNATPNYSLIEKLNAMQNSGWIIDIYTARGSVSCATRQEAEAKYKPQMIKWLNKHNVRYNSISFDKPLASYYIDDKGITPDDFLNIDFKDLKGGLSGSSIYSDGRYVHKEDRHIFEVVEWFNNADLLGINIPDITKTIGNTISMTHIDHDPNYFADNYYKAIGMILDALNKMKQCIFKNNELTFSDYIDRIKNNHLNVCNDDSFRDIILNNIISLSTIQLEDSFAHGDFGITNMLFKGNDLYLIDPIPYTYTNITLDVAKFIASLGINKYDRFIKPSINILSCAMNIDKEILKILIQSEMIRVFKYYPNKKEFKEMFNNVCKSI